MSQDGHADRGCSAALLWDSGVKFLVEWLQVVWTGEVLVLAGVLQWAAARLKTNGHCLETSSIHKCYLGNQLFFCIVKNRAEYWKVLTNCFGKTICILQIRIRGTLY